LLGEPVTADPKVTAILAKAHVEVQPIAGRVLAEFAAPLDRNNGRTADSLMGNFMADMMRDAAHTDIGIVNSGGVRDGLPKGTVTYNDLYGVMPFNNKMVTAHVPVELLVKNLELSIKTCGVRGALQISGIRLEFERNCERAVNAEDPQARLLKVVTNDGKVLYDATGASPVTAKETVTVATVDFMMTGGAGFTFFAGLPIDPNPPILRDAVADEMTKARAKPGRLDLSNFATGRYKNLLGDEQPAAPSSHHDEAGH
jgi:2',3'-cyclic-nucleotide 2'-phosphodiesterase (5'-nucleotidase family)